MNQNSRELQTLQDIRQMMERSSKFISLSGWSGISAGICALVGAYIVRQRMVQFSESVSPHSSLELEILSRDLILIAAGIFVAAFIAAMFFTFLKSKKDGVPIWGTTARRLLWNTLLPLMAGGFILWKMIDLHQFELIGPSTLIFYGLGLVNGSKYTMGEVRWLGYGELLLGLINLLDLNNQMVYWSLGFGVLHIIYGVSMWWKYDRMPIAKTE